MIGIQIQGRLIYWDFPFSRRHAGRTSHCLRPATTIIVYQIVKELGFEKQLVVIRQNIQKVVNTRITLLLVCDTRISTTCTSGELVLLRASVCETVRDGSSDVWKVEGGLEQGADGGLGYRHTGSAL